MRRTADSFPENGFYYAGSARGISTLVINFAIQAKMIPCLIALMRQLSGRDECDFRPVNPGSIVKKKRAHLYGVPWLFRVRLTPRIMAWPWLVTIAPAWPQVWIWRALQALSALSSP